MPFHTLDQLPQTTEETHFVPRSGSLEYPGFSGARYEGQWCNQRRFGKVIFKTVLTINWFLSIINEEIHSRNHFFFLAEISWQPKAHGELLAFEVWTLAKSDDKCIFQVNSLLSILEPCQPGHWKKKKKKEPTVQTQSTSLWKLFTPNCKVCTEEDQKRSYEQKRVSEDCPRHWEQWHMPLTQRPTPMLFLTQVYKSLTRK